jgi:hypothetical protein
MCQSNWTISLIVFAPFVAILLYGYWFDNWRTFNAVTDDALIGNLIFFGTLGAGFALYFGLC